MCGYVTDLGGHTAGPRALGPYVVHRSTFYVPRTLFWKIILQRKPFWGAYPMHEDFKFLLIRIGIKKETLSHSPDNTHQ